MDAWWTYRPSDFVMYSARSLERLVGTYNAELWPAQLAGLAAGLALLAATARVPRQATRPACALLAAACAWVGWGFLWQRQAGIDAMAPWLAGVWALQALLLALASTREPSPSGPPAWCRQAGLALASAGIVLGPALSLALGRAWRQVEVAGLLPDPTALAVLGSLLALPVRWRVPLLVLPVLLLAVGATLRVLLAG